MIPMSNHFVWPKYFVKILNESMPVILIKMVGRIIFNFDFFILLYIHIGDLLISSSDDDTIVVYDCESGL
jgi:hypothetical protein